MLKLLMLGSCLILVEVHAHVSMLQDEAIREAFETAKRQVSMEEPGEAVEQKSGCMRHKMSAE